MKAVAYYRVSSQQQAEKQSIDLQKIRLAKFAAEKGYEIVAEFHDDGISGEQIDKRPGFQKALEEIASGKVDFLLVYMIDRIGRFASRKDRNRVIELLEESKTSVDSPYHGLFEYDKEKKLNALEGLLNESRQDNVMRAIRVKEGHAASRLKGKLSGGRTPYGIFQDENGFSIGTKEFGTLKEIFDKLSNGWGCDRVRDYLNSYPSKFPKRVRKFKGKPVVKWSAPNILDFVHNDFYFTGIITPTKQNKEQGGLPVDTGLKDKLFDRKFIEVVRREVSTRRSRKVKSQQDKTIFIDALVHGIARCGLCGWKLGLQVVHNHEINRTYFYYLCRGRSIKLCKFKAMPAHKLDKFVWNKFVETIQNPTMMQKLILNEDFLLDKDRKSQEALLKKAKNDIKKFAEVKKRIGKQYTWGHIDDKEYEKEMKRILALQEQTEENIIKYTETLKRPKEVRYSVKRATELVAEQMEVIWALDKIKEMIADIKGIPSGKDILTKLQIAGTKTKLYGEIKEMIDDLKQKSTVNPDDLANDEIRKMIFQQKRAMLQKFIDFDKGKGIRVMGPKDVEFNFSIESF
jgi:site-specific DNA recombinase